ncbi:MAG: hypothetical protein EZS28_027607 [Streblomastix strix]|uniref:Uncharacterized protein n=1 Tax=Streblomastix strix TaxID=222440 RepID=A0A5J4V2L9_9EUKA|nr:MAG: hypothetical protein EZS28_027607 [Streblomastix strix]
MSQCANAIKYSSAYDDFTMNGDYNAEDTDKPINITVPNWTAKFTWKNRPTLDRINNELGHSKDNVLPYCLYCNNKHDKFNGFVQDFMQQLADAKSQKNDDLATFYKLILNSAFGGDINCRQLACSISGL